MAKARATLYPDFREFLRSLNSAGVRYLLVGGYAVNYHGHHRATQDLDVWIAVDRENAARLSRVLQEFGGFPAAKVRPSIFRDKGKIFQFGRVPVRIDVLTDPSGVSFEECYAHRIEAELDGVPVAIISLPDLLRNKVASGRPKDLADVEVLSQARRRRRKAK